MIKNRYIILFLFIICIACNNNHTIIETNSNPLQIDSLKTYFFLNGKEVSMNVIGEGLNRNKIEYVNWSNGTRDALLRFGEQYQGGIYIFKTISHEK